MSHPNAPSHVIAAGESLVTVRATKPHSVHALGTLPVPVWSAVLAIACSAGLLFAFQQVVHTSVRQAEGRHLAGAANAEAILRCSYRLVDERESCRVQLKAVQATDTAPNTPAASGP